MSGTRTRRSVSKLLAEFTRVGAGYPVFDVEKTGPAVPLPDDDEAPF